MKPTRRLRLIAHWNRQAGRAVPDAWTASSRPWVCSRAAGAVLDVCVGDGRNLPHYPAGVSVTGVDWSPAMVEASRRMAERLGMPADIRVADAERLPFPDGRFDTVVATFALCCVPDERAALAEMVRVLKPGGSLLLADTVASSNPLARLLEHASDLISVPMEGHHQTRRPLPVVESLGLRVVEVEEEHWRMIERLRAIKP